MVFMNMHFMVTAVLKIYCLALSVSPSPDEAILIPEVDGKWWKVADNPDLGEFTDPKQQPVDFGVWQAADGAWQLWSCIRHTKCGGNTRLFYGWEGKNLTDSDWKPMGIKMQADPEYGETPGGLQAPHVIKIGDLFHMFYGDWVNICLATSEDGKNFTRRLDADGKAGMFTEGLGNNTRDPIAMPLGDLYYCYYTAYPNRQGSVYCRTSSDLKNWSESRIVAFGGSAGTNPYSAECPFVVHHRESGYFYLFRTQRYGMDAQTSIYRSKDPLEFGINNDDKYLVSRLPVAAPEIIEYDGNYYIACLLPELNGIRIARIKWSPRAEIVIGALPSGCEIGESLMDFGDPDVRAEWRVVQGQIDPIFTTSTRQDFGSYHSHFIGTAESRRGGPDDEQSGIIESPVFTLKESRHVLMVSGGSNIANLYVALMEVENNSEIVRVTGYNSNMLEKVLIDTSKYKGRKVRIRIVDQETENWGHINFGGIFTCKREGK